MCTNLEENFLKEKLLNFLVVIGVFVLEIWIEELCFSFFSFFLDRNLLIVIALLELELG